MSKTKLASFFLGHGV